MPSIAISGVIPSLVTPFDSSGRIQFDCLRREVEYLSQTGVHALCVGGLVGELAGAAPEEVHQVCKAVVDEADIPVVANLFPDCTAEALLLAEAATSAGVDVLMVAPPHYLFQPETDELLQLFTSVRNKVRIPLFLSNSIQTAAASLPAIRCLMDHQSVDGVYHGISDAHLLADLLRIRPRVAIYSGIEDLLYLSLLLGAEGCISILALLFPRTSLQLYEAVGQGNHDLARALHERLLRFWHRFNHPTHLLPRLKAGLAAMGRESGFSRSPYDAATSTDVPQLKILLSDLS
ncbi:MAG: dihydrodipicolinate synthase family protein [Acidobacteriota bacterium]